LGARRWTSSLTLTLGLSLSAQAGIAATSARVDTLSIPAGKKAKVDGLIRPGEWTDAERLEIQAGPDWVIPVFIKHDGEALYVAFSNLVSGSSERYPEVLLDVAGEGGGWDESDWWLHASHDDCTGRGFYGVYGHTCSQDAEGWYANNFPLGSQHVVEFRISLGFVGLEASRSGTRPPLSLALAVAESESRSIAVGGNDERRQFWPLGATMAPGSWSAARLAPIARRSRR